jgi:heat shock protein HtpX
MSSAAIGPGRQRRARRHSALLVLAMLALFAYCGWVLAAAAGIVASLFAGVMTLLLLRRVPTALLLGAIRAREVWPPGAPELYDIRDRLCRQAGIAEPPHLYWVGGRFPVAFTIGQGEGTAIVLARDLVEGLEWREIRAILAHELVHVRNHDIALMQFAMVLGRLTRSLAQVALLLLFMSLFLRAFAVAALPLPPLLLLVFAPVGVDLLQLALARTREMEADLEAAELTGDPQALASALSKIRRREQSLFQAMFPNAVPLRLPPLFRDHPATEERIRRLLEMPQQGPPAADEVVGSGFRLW